VAVKVQKPAIEKQMDWDLFSYRWVGGLAAQRRGMGEAHGQGSDVVLRETVRHAE